MEAFSIHFRRVAERFSAGIKIDRKITCRFTGPCFATALAFRLGKRQVIFRAVLSLLLISCWMSLGVAECSAGPSVVDSPDFLSAGPVGANASLVESSLQAGDIAGLEHKLRDIVLQGIEKAGQTDDLLPVLGNPRVRASLVQQELIRCVGKNMIEEIAAREGGAAFLKAFLTDPDGIESFLVSDPPAHRHYLPTISYPKALSNLYYLHRYGEDLDKPLYRRLATALAMQYGGVPYRIVERLKDIQAAHRQGLLHASFDTLDVRKMRWALHLDGDHAEFQYLLNERQQKIGDYMGACWAVAWLHWNPYGDWLQGPHFYRPWHHCFDGHEIARILGGQCENLSLFGCAAARAHGVMASVVGQPGHAAYIVRIGERWPIAYDCHGPANTYFTVPGWDGTGYISATWLYEHVQHDRAHFLAANRLAMIARLLSSETRAETRVLTDLRYALYRPGVGDKLPDFSKLKADAEGSATAIDLEAVIPGSRVNFGVVWTGGLEVAREGDVKVILRSDDQSRVIIDGQTILDLSCRREEKVVKLTAGQHPLRVEYCQGGGHAYIEVEFRGVNVPGEWQSVYSQAIKAQPLNYGTWIECVKEFENTPGISPAAWRKLASYALKAFSAYHGAAWALADRAAQNALPAMKPEERLAFFVACHKNIAKAGMKQIGGYRFDNILNWQADRLGDPSLPIKFFNHLLPLYNSVPPNDWNFSTLMQWGQNRFSRGDPKIATQFAQGIGNFFRRQSGANKDLLRNQFRNGIRVAIERGDMESTQVWTRLGQELLPKLRPADVFLSPEQLKAFPKVEPFPGQLLSAAGILRTSSADGNDRPLSYRAILQGTGFGGFFHTHSEENPWAQVQLPGNASISGIVVVNRYEADSGRQVPLKISVSKDGAAWTPVATFDKAENMFRADLAGKNTEAKFVRVERTKIPGRRDPFHLRSILIYGKKLY